MATTGRTHDGAAGLASPKDDTKDLGRSASHGNTSGGRRRVGGAGEGGSLDDANGSVVDAHSVALGASSDSPKSSSSLGLGMPLRHHQNQQSATTPIFELQQDPLVSGPLHSSPSHPSNASSATSIADSTKRQEPFKGSSTLSRAAATPSPIDTKLAGRMVKRGSLKEGERRPISPHITSATPTAARHSMTASSPSQSNSERRSSAAPNLSDTPPNRQNSLSRVAAHAAQSLIDAVSGVGGRSTPPANAGYPYRPDSASAVSRRHVASPEAMGSAHVLFDGAGEDEYYDDESGKGHRFPVPPAPPRRSSAGPSSGRWTPTILTGLASRRADGAGFSPVNLFHSSHQSPQHQQRHHITDQSPRFKGLVIEPEEIEEEEEAAGAANAAAAASETAATSAPTVPSTMTDGRKTPAHYRPQSSSNAKGSYYPPAPQNSSSYRTVSHPLSHAHTMSTSSTSNSSHSIHMNSPPRMSMSTNASHSRHASFQPSPVLLASNPATATSSPLIVPQARRGAMNLKKPRRRQGQRSRRARSSLGASKPPSIPAYKQVFRVAKAICFAIAHPMQSARHVAATGASTLREIDDAFRDPRTGARVWRPAWLSAYVPLLIWLVVSLGSTFTVLIWHTQVFRALDNLSTHLQELGAKGRVILGALIFITTFPPLPLYSTLIVLCGFSFGLVQGFIISYIAALTGAIVVFLLSRSLLRGWMLGLLNQSGGLKKVVRAIEKRPKLLFLVRLAPYPYNLMNTLLASSPTLTLRTYTLCTALALPKLLVHCGLGTTIKNFAAYNGAGGGSRTGSSNSTIGSNKEDLPNSDPLSSSSNVTTGIPDDASASEMAEVIKHVAGFLGVGLCVGIFIYLFTIARRAVDEELDEDDDGQYDLVLTEEEEEDGVEGRGGDEDDEDELDADSLSIGGYHDQDGVRKDSGGSSTDLDERNNRHYRISMSENAPSSVSSPVMRSGGGTRLAAPPSQLQSRPHHEIHNHRHHPRYPSDGTTPNYVAPVPGATYFSSTNHTSGFFAYESKNDKVNGGAVAGDTSVVSLADSIAEMEKQVECSSDEDETEGDGRKGSGRNNSRRQGRHGRAEEEENEEDEDEDEKRSFLAHSRMSRRSQGGLEEEWAFDTQRDPPRR